MRIVEEKQPGAKEVETQYETIAASGRLALLKVRLITGRTHQIRAHMRHIGHPLFNDGRYGGDEILRGTKSSTYNSFIRHCFAACPRQALHARTLGFRHPRTGEEMDFSAPLPPDMQALIERWRTYIAGLKPQENPAAG